MDYRTWSEEYFAEADRVRERLERLRREPLPQSRDEHLLRQRRAAILYNMYLECLHTARLLAARALPEGGEENA